MKKRIIAFLLSVFTLSGCQSVSDTAAVSEGDIQTNAESTSSVNKLSHEIDDKNILVAYFFGADNAIIEAEVDAVTYLSVISPGNVAEGVQQETEADLFSI